MGICMNLSDVSKDDCKYVAQLINMLQIATMEINGKDMCAGADSLRWLQALAVNMASAYAGGANTQAPVPAASEGLKVRAYNPGGRGK